MAKLDIDWRPATSTASELKKKQAEAKKIYGDDIARVSTVLETWNDDPEEALSDWVASQGYQWRQTRDVAAQIGTHTHQLIEDALTLFARGQLRFDDFANSVITFQKLTASFQRVPQHLQQQVMLCFSSFCRWFAQFPHVEVIAIEERVICPDLKLGGTCDFKAVFDWGAGPKRVMIDWKTSNKTYTKHLVQLGAYSILHKWKHPNDPPFDFYGTVRFDKKMGGYEEHFAGPADIAKAEEFFLHLLKGYHMRKNLPSF